MSDGENPSALDSASSGFGHLAWTYDRNGNRQSETRNAGTTPYTYSPPNWLVQKGSETRPQTIDTNPRRAQPSPVNQDGSRLAHTGGRSARD